MKKYSNSYKTITPGKQFRSLSYAVLKWMRLLVFSFKPQKIKILPNINSHDHDNPLLFKLITRTRTITEKKLVIIKNYQS